MNASDTKRSQQQVFWFLTLVALAFIVLGANNIGLLKGLFTAPYSIASPREKKRGVKKTTDMAARVKSHALKHALSRAG